jgi:sialidase-1
MLCALAMLVASLAEAKPVGAAQGAAAQPEPAAFSGFTEVKLFGGCRIPALVVTNKGTLLAFCERRNTSSDSGDNDVWCKRSTDGGKTWSEEIVIDDDGRRTSGNPCPVADRTTGTIWLGFGRDHVKKIMISHSKDDGQTWAEPCEITDRIKRPGWGPMMAFGPGHGIQLTSGRLLLPHNHTREREGATEDDPAGRHDHVIYSDDHGKTWKLGGIVPGIYTGENSITEMADGSLYLNARAGGRARGKRLISRSCDGGLTWSSAEETIGLTDPVQYGTGCQASVVRLTDENRHDRNRVLFCNPAGERREDLTLRISYDECQTWQKCKVLHSGRDASYSDMALLPDMSIGLLYETNATGWQSIWFARFTLEWLTDGRDRMTPETQAAGAGN